MESDRTLRINWRSINVPALAAMMGMLAMGINAVSSITANLERIDARLDAIEDARIREAAEAEKRRLPVLEKVGEIPNLSYRIARAEEALVQMSLRQDRFADALGGLRDGISEVNTSVKVLTERLERALVIPQNTSPKPTP